MNGEAALEEEGEEFIPRRASSRPPFIPVSLHPFLLLPPAAPGPLCRRCAGQPQARCSAERRSLAVRNLGSFPPSPWLLCRNQTAFRAAVRAGAGLLSAGPARGRKEIPGRCDVAAGAVPGPGRASPAPTPPAERACSDSSCPAPLSPVGCTVWWLEGIAGSSLAAAWLVAFTKLGVVIQNGHLLCGVCVARTIRTGNAGLVVHGGLTELDFAFSPLSFSFFSENDWF